MRPFLIAVLRCTVILLASLGVVSAIGRGFILAYPDHRGIAYFQEQFLHSIQRNDAVVLQWLQELRELDRKFAADWVLTLLHIVPGGIFLVFALLQFSERVRSRHIRFHRWSGRVLVVAAFAAGVTGWYFGVLTPYGGLSEGSATAVFGGLFLAAIGRAFVAIRRGQVALHREWMIRAFALAISVSTVRLVGAPLQAVAPVSFHELRGPSFWIGWAITLGAAELWIRYTRRVDQPESSAG